MNDSEQVYQTYYEDVFRFLRGLSADETLAEELTQETFYRALKSIDTFRGDSGLRVWLCSIAKNLYYTYCRDRKRDSERGQADLYETEERHFTELIADRALALQVHKILHSLREPYKEIFSLRIFGELSFREIGEVFGKSEHWACVTYHRAKAMIWERAKEEWK
ncbi:MAG: sigma-70 family RNA polymerase sigma factor [Oscillospiraceae bacterium]|nr:sigma-70 family RNA polymerase sigma factor [Oscillospiraceae bacterium]